MSKNTSKKLKINKTWNQQNGESYDDWRIRVLLAKGKGDCKLSWQQIISLLRISCSRDALRHAVYGMCALDDYRNDCKITGSDEEEYEKLEMQKMQIADQRRELRKLLREEARAEHLQNTIKTAINDLAAKRPLLLNKEKTNLELKNNKEAALILSDWHYGIWIDTYNNLFNEAEFLSRVDYLVKKTIEYSKLHDAKVLNVFLLGDLISGLIHVNTRVQQTEDVIQQTIKVSEVLSIILTELARHFGFVKVYSCRGNHDRVIANKVENLNSESFFDLIPWYLESRLQAIQNIGFEHSIDGEIIQTTILNSNIVAVHGHRDSIKSAAANLSLMLKKIPDYIIMGHTHHDQTEEINGVETIVNPSLVGSDEYAVNIRKTSKPAQKLLIFDESGLECTYKINLDLEK